MNRRIKSVLIQVGHRAITTTISSVSNVIHPLITITETESLKYPALIRGFATQRKSDLIACKVENGIRYIRLNRPEKKNALLAEMYATLSQMLSEGDSDNATKLIVLSGSGDYFTSGNDMHYYKPLALQLLSGAELNEEDFLKPKRVFKKLVTTLIDLKKPLIALVNGPSIGIGTTLLGLCDSAFCTDQATFHTPFSILGIPPECCSSYTFPKIMGYVKATEMLVHSVKFTAQDALNCRLVNCVFPDDIFEEKAWERVEFIARMPLKELVVGKELIRAPDRKILHKVNEAELAALDFKTVLKRAAKALKWVEKKSK